MKGGGEDNKYRRRGMKQRKEEAGQTERASGNKERYRHSLIQSESKNKKKKEGQ
jgi:hypothetical protein